jgi:hypothetical protein
VGIDDERLKLSLTKPCQAVEELLPTNEYLVDRHSICLGNEYQALSVKAKWLPDYGSISVQVTFKATPEKLDSLRALLDDEGVIDDIDSGVGELFEEALRREYPAFNWDYPIGEVNIKAVKA